MYVGGEAQQKQTYGNRIIAIIKYAWFQLSWESKNKENHQIISFSLPDINKYSRLSRWYLPKVLPSTYTGF